MKFMQILKTLFSKARYSGTKLKRKEWKMEIENLYINY